MAASDKLRNLQGAASKERTQEELFAAFPQLLAVVEAAERAHDEPHDFAAGVGWGSMGAALAALEEALS